MSETDCPERQWVLDEAGKPRLAKTREEVRAMWDDPRRIVEQTDVGRYRVSTIFLILDHGSADGPPVLWETVISDPDHEVSCQRYRTRAAAETGHCEAVVEAGRLMGAR